MHQYMAQRVTYARHLSRATIAAAVAHAGIKMSKKFTTKFTKFFPGIGNRKEAHKLRVQAFASLQAPGLGNQGTSVQAGPGHKQQGQKYFFYG